MTITKPSKTYSFTPGTGIRSSQTNTNFDDVFDVFEEDAYLAKGWFAVDNASFEYHASNAIKTTSDIDLTVILQAGDKITFEQATDGEKFGFVTAIDYNSTVANRTYIEVYGGTDYDVDNEAITADTVGFSRGRAPYGWPSTGFIPAFFVFRNASQSISNATFTKVQFETEDFDAAGNYDNSTNYRFTAPIAGVYQFNSACRINDIGVGNIAILSLYKNGSELTRVEEGAVSVTADVTPKISTVLDLAANDYIEIFIRQVSGVSKDLQAESGGVRFCYFSGVLVNSIINN